MARSTRVELEITALGGRGDGIAETAKTRVFVPYTLPGDRVEAELGAATEGGRHGQLTALLAPGPARAEPPCQHFHVCGGCGLQHVEAGFYAAWKQAQVAAALARRDLGDVPVAPLRTIAPGDRRRADLVARRLGDRLLLGFHQRASHKIVDLAECLVLDPQLVALLPALRQLLKELLESGATADLKVMLTENGVDLLIEGRVAIDLARRERLAAFAEAHGLARLSLKDAGTGFLDPIARRRPAVVRFGGVAVEPPPGAFLQASPAAEAVLVAQVVAAAQGAKRVADLFAGCGTFSLPLSEHAEVLAVESEAAPLLALKSAANAAQRRVQCEQRDLTRRPLLADELKRFDAVVFDPPRAGAREQAVALAASNVPVVVGVSCQPASFARDARILVDGGYRLESVAPVDQFLWTTHVELVGVFRR